MIGGGREPLSPRRPYTRTHAPAITDTGTTGQSRPPDFRCHAGAAPPCPCMSDLDWRCRAVDICPNPNFSEGPARRLTQPTYVGAAARRQVERCAPVRSSFAIYHRWTNSLQAPRSPLSTGRNPIVLVLARLLRRGEVRGEMPVWISARSASLPLHSARGGACRCTPPGAMAVHSD